MIPVKTPRVMALAGWTAATGDGNHGRSSGSSCDGRLPECPMNLLNPQQIPPDVPENLQNPQSASALETLPGACPT